MEIVCLLKECGKFASIDQQFLLTPPMIGTILFQNTGKNKITYSMILNILIQYSQSNEYKTLRDELLLNESTNLNHVQSKIENPISYFKNFTSIEIASSEANREKKKILLFFVLKQCQMLTKQL